MNDETNDNDKNTQYSLIMEGIEDMVAYFSGFRAQLMANGWSKDNAEKLVIEVFCANASSQTSN